MTEQERAELRPVSTRYEHSLWMPCKPRIPAILERPWLWHPLSIGHASMPLYSMRHLCGVKAVNPKYETLGELSVPLDDIKRFGQLDSRCSGHPEYRWTSGVPRMASKV